jgi:hypothetical protein
MKLLINLILFTVLLYVSSCVTKFIPETGENRELVVVEGLISNQPEPDTIKLYKSTPLGTRTRKSPIEYCTVIIEDNLGGVFYLSETGQGIYVTPEEFTGVIGLKYTLKIFTNSLSEFNYSYESYPMEMKPVPAIDKIFYERTVIEEASEE